MAYLKQEFIDYMLNIEHNASPNVYCSQLNGIEKSLSADIDFEYQNDECLALLKKLDDYYKTPEKIGKSKDAIKNYKLGLGKYKSFRKWKQNNATNLPATVINKVNIVINSYRENFETVNKQELYKWEAISHYKKYWDIDAEDFAGMLSKAFAKTYNLLSSGNYYPYKTITEYAKRNPEVVRQMFRTLHDETLSLSERYDVFRANAQNYIEILKNENPNRDKPLNHYQDLRAIMVYLTFEYPEKYYLYKYSMFTEFKKRVGYDDDVKEDTGVSKYESFHKLCEGVKQLIDGALASRSFSRLHQDCYKDDALHLLTMDIIYYGSKYMNPEDFLPKFEIAPNEYWPSPEEYEPNISKEQWIEYLITIEMPNHPCPMAMLRGLMEFNENAEATCKQLADKYGGKPARFIGNAVNLGKRAKKYFNLPPCLDDGQERFFPVPFLGRRIKENNKINYAYRIRPELYEALLTLDLSAFDPYDIAEDFDSESPKESSMYSKTNVPLNTILYGPPGTGKTYHTVIYAVAIVEGKELAVVEAEAKENYDAVFTRYKEYKKQGYIEFTTFHQSYGYEEFIEGIRPEIDDNGNVIYSIKDGVFKHFCYYADDNLWRFEEAYNKLEAKIVADGNRFSANNGNISLTYNSGNNGAFGRPDLYDFWLYHKVENSKLLYQDAIATLVDTMISDFSLPKSPLPVRNHVFIIDEINRGNISKIFGELITLIEPSKRIGAAEEMTAVLPYSQKPFGVPNNVYIIGTMNTADRSIAAIDTALRRRFQFREMMPNPDVLTDITVDGISISDMLTRMNKRIEVLYDREHTIGHAYFMPLKDAPTVETLASIFSNSIIPLLQEYFYEDYEKIRLVLGDNRKTDDSVTFITRKQDSYAELFGTMDLDLDEGYIYEINKSAFGNIESYKSI